MQFARFTRILRVLLFIKPAHAQEDRLNKALLGSALTTFWGADREDSDADSESESESSLAPASFANRTKRSHQTCISIAE